MKYLFLICAILGWVACGGDTVQSDADSGSEVIYDVESDTATDADSAPDAHADADADALPDTDFDADTNVDSDADSTTDTADLPDTDTDTDADPTPPIPSECERLGSGQDFADRTFQSFSGAGQTGQYHLYASGLPTDQALGLLVQLHGDGAWEFGRPNSAKLAGMRDIARDHNMVMIAAKTPDTDTVTWWQQGRDNAEWLQALIEQVAYQGYWIDTRRVWFSGYSGGAEFLSYYYIDMMSETFCDGGALISGGGGANSSVPGDIPASPALKQKFRMHWYSGQDDISENASDGFCGYCAAQQGAAYYQDQGFAKVTTEFPAGVDHYELDEVRVLREQLDAAYPD